MTIKILIITTVLALTSCSSIENESQINWGKWKFYQDQNIYTEVWIDKNYAVLIDNVEDVHIFRYTLSQDTLSLTEVGQTEQQSFIEKARHLSIIKNVIEGREDKWVSKLKPILEKDIALTDTVFKIDTSIAYRQKVMKEFAERHRQK